MARRAGQREGALLRELPQQPLDPAVEPVDVAHRLGEHQDALSGNCFYVVIFAVFQDLIRFCALLQPYPADTRGPGFLHERFRIRERAGRTEGVRVAYLGDGASNMANSWVLAAMMAGIEVAIRESARERGVVILTDIDPELDRIITDAIELDATNPQRVR